MPDTSEGKERLSTGITGLDEVLHGGLVPQQSYLVRGSAGTGKTTIGCHFLTAAAANGEKSLFITLGTPEARIRLNAQISRVRPDRHPDHRPDPGPGLLRRVQDLRHFLAG